MNSRLVKLLLVPPLLLCLFDWDYGFYMFVRVLVTVAMIYLYFNEDRKNAKYIWLGIALLFQPLFKISLGRTVWNITDIALAVYLILDVLRIMPFVKQQYSDEQSPDD